MDGLMSGRPRVLICDNDEGVVTTLTGVLAEQTNFDVRCCDSLFAAGMECERFRPHVMLYDLSVSDGDGQRGLSPHPRERGAPGHEDRRHEHRVTDGQISQLVGCGFDSVLGSRSRCDR